MRTLAVVVAVLLSSGACPTVNANSSSASQTADTPPVFRDPDTPPVFLEPDTQPVSRPLEPMAEPARYVGAVAEYLRNGTPFEQTRVALTDTEETWRTSYGCEWSRHVSGFAPPSSWKSCDGSDGTQEVTVNGSIWPLQIGSKVSYDMSRKHDYIGTWTASTRTCEVKEETRVTVPAGTYDTFHVVCNEPWSTGHWSAGHWYVSPEIGVVVLHWSGFQRSRDTGRFELVSWDPGGAN
jgi:hypothetical protein